MDACISLRTLRGKPHLIADTITYFRDPHSPDVAEPVIAPQGLLLFRRLGQSAQLGVIRLAMYLIVTVIALVHYRQREISLARTDRQRMRNNAMQKSRIISRDGLLRGIVVLAGALLPLAGATGAASPTVASKASSSAPAASTPPANGHWVPYTSVQPSVAVQPEMQVPCPAGTINYRGAAQPYSCLRVFLDESGHQVILRQGRSGAENSAFGLLHLQIDHGLNEHQAELLIQDSPAGIAQGNNRFIYGMTFKINGNSLVSLQFIEDRKPSNQAPDKHPLGIVTGFCRGGDQNAPIENHCPPLPPPFN